MSPMVPVWQPPVKIYDRIPRITLQMKPITGPARTRFIIHLLHEPCPCRFTLSPLHRLPWRGLTPTRTPIFSTVPGMLYRLTDLPFKAPPCIERVRFHPCRFEQKRGNRKTHDPTRPRDGTLGLRRYYRANSSKKRCEKNQAEHVELTTPLGFFCTSCGRTARRTPRGLPPS